MGKLMKLMTLVTLILVMIVSTFAFAGSQGQSFSDIENHWAKQWIMDLSSKTTIDGVSNGKFRPDDPIKVGEFLKLAMSAADPKAKFRTQWDDYINTGQVGRNEKHKYMGVLISAYDRSVLRREQIYPSAKDLERPITRNEMAAVTNGINYYIRNEASVDDYGIFKLVPGYESIPSKFKYVNIQAYGKGLVSGNIGGPYQGDDTISRAEACVIVSRLVDPSKRIQNVMDAILVENRKEIADDNYSKEMLFKNSKSSRMTIDLLETRDKGTFWLADVNNFYRYTNEYYKNLAFQGISPGYNNTIDMFGFKGRLKINTFGSYLVGGYKVSIGYNTGPRFNEYTEFEMKTILDNISLLLSNSYGKDSESYKVLIQAVLDSLDGKIVEDFVIPFELDGHIARAAKFSIDKFSSPNTITVTVSEDPAKIEYITSISEVADFENRFTSFQDMNISYEDLETDIRKYPEIMEKYSDTDSGLYYRYIPKYRDGIDFHSRYESSASALQIHSEDNGEYVRHYFMFGFNNSNSLRFEQYTKEEVAKTINIASAYIYSETNPMVHKKIMTDFMDYLELIHLTPNKLPFGDDFINQPLMLKEDTLNGVGYTEDVKFDSSKLSFIPSKQYFFISVKDYTKARHEYK